MMDQPARGLGAAVIRLRLPIGIILLLATAVMAYWACRVRIATNFVDFFPVDHPNVQLYQKYLRYGSAEKIIVVVEVKHGDIFNAATLSKIQDIQYAVDALPNINHNMVLSLASYMTAYIVAVPGGLTWYNYMYPDAPKTPAQIDHLRHLVLAHLTSLRSLVSPDLKSAAIVGTFNQQSQDYSALFQDIQKIVHQEQDANDAIYLAGEPIVRGYGYYYFPVLATLFVISIAIMLAALYLCLGRSGSWWVPAVTGTLSAVWGLGFVGIKGYYFDPLMIVVPLLLTARDISHGVQWQRRYFYLLGQTGDPRQACIRTTNYMFPAGLLAILADIAGIIFISFCGIPVLEHIAQAGTVWLAASLTMVFIFQPILMSYMPSLGLEQALTFREDGSPDRLGMRLARMGVEAGPARSALMLGAAGFLVWGIVSGLRAQVGYFQPGTPLYRSSAKVNRDLAAVEKNFPTDEGWIIVTPRPGLNVMDTRILRLETHLRGFLGPEPVVRDFASVATDVIEPSHRVLFDGHPKFVGLPSRAPLAIYSVMMFMRNRAAGTMDQYVLDNTACVRVILRDHTAATLDTIRRLIDRFNREHLGAHPEVPGVTLRYLGGIAGLYAAANDVLLRLDLENITFVLLCIFIFCTVAFRSPLAGLLFVFACVMANFGAFIYMRLRSIGLTIDTLPVISLGIGLGVDYGIYTVSRIKDEVRSGMPLAQAAVLAKRSTGATVLIVLSIMIGALIPWMFSPALFHTNMSLMLALLMLFNLVAGVVVLPAFIVWARVGFIARYAPSAPPERAARTAGSRASS